jgi:hypothetical protein
MSPALEKMFNEVKALPVEEQRRLRGFLEALLSSSTEAQEERLARLLLQAGLIAELKPKGLNAQTHHQYTPIQVQGKPVSESLVEERR